MKVVKGLVVAALVVSMAGVASASSIGAKLWYAEADGVEDPAMHYGVTGSLSLGGDLWISAMYLMGTFDNVGATPARSGVAAYSGASVDTVDGEVVLGYTANIVDVGLGARYSEWTIGDATESLAIFGPMVYIGLGNSFGESPLGWYVGGSYMFKDFGDAYDENAEDTFEHYNIEGGLFLSIEALVATVGYRVKDYVNFDDSAFSGVAGSVGFGF